jgi:very-short-patch-repair endonuclease
LPLKRIDKYINAYTKINWQCLQCNYIWLAQPGEITRQGHTKNGGGSGCPECARGKNEKRVGEVLSQLNIKIEKLRINLPTGQKLFPDFYLPELNTIIEYNGIQHYQPTCFGSMSQLDAEISFQRQRNRDNILREYCKERQVSLLEIDGRKYKGDNLKKFVSDYFMNEVSYV